MGRGCTHCHYPTPFPLGATQSKGTGGMGGAGLALVSQHGGPADPPPRAPECPFSGLSLTMATSFPIHPWVDMEALPALSPPPPPEPGLTQVPNEFPLPPPKGSIPSLPTFRKMSSLRYPGTNLPPPQCPGQMSHDLLSSRNLWHPSLSLGGKHYAIQAFSLCTRVSASGVAPKPSPGQLSLGSGWVFQAGPLDSPLAFSFSSCFISF